MLTTHIYFNGQCKQAVELYKQALGATVKTMIEAPNTAHVIHAEIEIHGDLLILNDYGNDDGVSVSGGYQLCVRFEDEATLRTAFAQMQTGSVAIEPMQPTEYSPCTVRFIDRFDVRWAFWV